MKSRQSLKLGYFMSKLGHFVKYKKNVVYIL